MYKFSLTKVFILLATISTLLKLLLPLLGSNADMLSWQIVGDFVSQGKTVYDNTARYNYGPTWGYILGIIATTVKLVWQSNVFVPGFHFIVSALLSIFDIGIGIMLWKMFGKIPAYLFLINPISILISGSHGQFDNFAILVGLMAWYLLLKNKFTGYIVLGISITIKHLFLFFPIWLLLKSLLTKDKNEIMKVIKGICISYSIFVAGFCIEIIRNIANSQQIINGIIKNVFNYRGYDIGLGTLITNTLIPPQLLELSKQLPVIKSYMFFYIIGIAIAGFVVLKFKIENKYLPILYLLVFYSLAISEARQYAAIPIVGIVVFYRKIAALISIILGFIYVMTTSYNNFISKDQVDIFVYFSSKLIPNIPYTLGWYVSQVNFQAWTLILFITVLIFGVKVKSFNYISIKYSLILVTLYFFTTLIIANSVYFHLTKTLPADFEIINSNTYTTIICKRPIIGYAFKVYNPLTLQKFNNCNYDFPLY